MAKIVNKTDLTLGTNLILHIADKGGTDISIDATNSQINSVTTDFVASSTTGGITNRAIAVGDVIEVSHTSEPSNEDLVVEVTVVTANQITFTAVEGTAVDEAAGSDINLVARKKTYQFVEAGALSFIDGVQGGILHSVLVDLFFTQDLDKYAPPFRSIEPRGKSMASINYWEPHDDSTLNAIRDMALEIRDTATSAARRIYSLFRTSGDLDELSDQMFLWPDTDAELDAPRQAVTTGYVNQLFLVFDSDNGIDDRGTWYYRCAEPGKLILYGTETAQFAEIVPLGNNNPVDPKLADPGTKAPFTDDATISNVSGSYANIEYFLDTDLIYSGTVDGVAYDFRGYVEADGKTNEQVHEKISYLLRQPTDINADGTGQPLRGDKQPPITEFSGNVFTVQSFLENLNTAQRNDLRLVDATGTTRQFPLVNTITVSAAALAHGGTFTIYHASSFGTSAATVLQDELGVPQQDITTTAVVNIPFAYSTYNVDGHTPNTPLDVVVAYGRPGFIEPGLTDAVTLNGNDVNIQLPLTADPSYIA